jgi:hypothetical protein
VGPTQKVFSVTGMLNHNRNLFLRFSIKLAIVWVTSGHTSSPCGITRMLTACVPVGNAWAFSEAEFGFNCVKQVGHIPFPSFMFEVILLKGVEEND